MYSDCLLVCELNGVTIAGQEGRAALQQSLRSSGGVGISGAGDEDANSTAPAAMPAAAAVHRPRSSLRSTAAAEHGPASTAGTDVAPRSSPDAPSVAAPGEKIETRKRNECFPQDGESIVSINSWLCDF